MVIVGAAGSCGAISRFLLYELGEVQIGIDHSHLTLCINIVGTFFLSFLAVRIVQGSLILQVEGGRILNGFLGAFTTFSAFVNDSINLGDSSSSSSSASSVTVDPALLGTSIGIALFFAFLGSYLAQLQEPVHNSLEPEKHNPDEHDPDGYDPERYDPEEHDPDARNRGEMIDTA